MRDAELTTIIKQQGEDEAQKSMEKKQQAITSSPTGKALLLVQCVPNLHHFFQSSIPQNLGFTSKIITLAMDSMFFFADRLLHLQAVFRVSKKCHSEHRIALHKLVVSRDDLHQYIDEPHRKYHQQSCHNFTGIPTFDIWSLGYIFYHLLFSSPLCNFDCQQINILLYVLIYHCFHFFEILMTLILALLGISENMRILENKD